MLRCRQRAGLFQAGRRGAAAGQKHSGISLRMARRPKGFSGERRSAFFGFQMTPTERRNLEQGAEAHRLLLAEFVRVCLPLGGASNDNGRRRASRPRPWPLVGDLGRIGNNLNQSSRAQKSFCRARDGGGYQSACQTDGAAATSDARRRSSTTIAGLSGARASGKRRGTAERRRRVRELFLEPQKPRFSHPPPIVRLLPGIALASFQGKRCVCIYKIPLST